DRAGALSLDQLLGDLPAVEPGHHHVEQDHVRLVIARLLEPGRAVARLEHLHPLRLEVHAAEEPDRRLVIDYKHPGHSPSLSAALYPFLGGFTRACGRRRREREREGERRALALDRTNPDPAVHRGQELLRDEEAQDGPAAREGTACGL